MRCPRHRRPSSPFQYPTQCAVVHREEDGNAANDDDDDDDDDDNNDNDNDNDGGKRRDRDVEGERLLELASRQLRGGECDEFDECDESTLMRNANGVAAAAAAAAAARVVVCRPFPRRGHRALACLSSWAVMLFVAMIVVGSISDDGGSESLPSRRLPTGTIESL
jgi:hypothetical protein